MNTTLTGAGLLAGALLLGGGAARAALIDYRAGGVDLVWDNDYGTTGLTWLKNANRSGTELSPGGNYSWLFHTSYGAQNHDGKRSDAHHSAPR